MNIGKRVDYGSVRVCPLYEGPGIRQSTLSVLDVSYTVKEYAGPWWSGACVRKKREKVILNGVTLQLKTGQITAILGSSGSGKTSLLDVISSRTCGRVTGGVYFNNYRCSRDVIQQRGTYVMQADRLLPNLSVRETLQYAARLKLPGKSTIQEINEKVNRVILEMGLKDVADSRIGGSVIRGISGGEQRRVTIALQLLKDPEIILLDEPTTGLDSHTARYIITNLRDMARRGKIVLLTIHQPSSDIFTKFDQIGILSHGHVVYCGPRQEMVPYFTGRGYPCEKYTNPLDRYIDVASIDRRDKTRENESFTRVGKLIEDFKTSDIYTDTVEKVMGATMTSSIFEMSNGNGSAPGYPRLLYTLLCRMNVNLFRDRKDYVARILLLPLIFIFIILFLGRLKHTQASVQDRIGVIYQASSFTPFIAVINAVALFPSLRNLYYRECRDGLYSTTTFILAYSLHVLPLHLLSSVIFSSATYWAVGMYPEAARFGKFLAVVFAMLYWGELFFVGCMGIFSSSDLARGTSALIMSVAVIIGSGLVKTISDLVAPFRVLSWIFIPRYTVEILIATEFHDLELECDPDPRVPCLFPNGNEYIKQFYPGAVENMGRNFGATAGYIAGTFILAILAYKVRGIRNLN